MHIVWDQDLAKDVSGLDGPKVATEQHIFSCHLVILESAWPPCWFLFDVNSC